MEHPSTITKSTKLWISYKDKKLPEKLQKYLTTGYVCNSNFSYSSPDLGYGIGFLDGSPFKKHPNTHSEHGGGSNMLDTYFSSARTVFFFKMEGLMSSYKYQSILLHNPLAF